MGTVTAKQDLLGLTFAEKSKVSWAEVVFRKHLTKSCRRSYTFSLSQTMSVKMKVFTEAEPSESCLNVVVRREKDTRCTTRKLTLTLTFVLMQTTSCFDCYMTNKPQDHMKGKKCFPHHQLKEHEVSLFYDFTKTQEHLYRVAALQLLATHIFSRVLTDTQPIWGISLAGIPISMNAKHTTNNGTVHFNWTKNDDLKHISPQKCEKVPKGQHLFGQCWQFSSVFNNDTNVLFFSNRAIFYPLCSYENSLRGNPEEKLFKESGFQLKQSLISWVEASHACSTTGGHLPVFRDKEELHNFLSFVQTLAIQNYLSSIELIYIGLVEKKTLVGGEVGIVCTLFSSIVLLVLLSPAQANRK